MLRVVLMMVFALHGSACLRAIDDCPAFVESLAKEAFARAKMADIKEAEGEFRQFFCSAFLPGFLSPEARFGSASPVSFRLGFEAGQSYRISFPQRISAVLTAYGYVEVERIGQFFRNRHTSGFCPDDQPRAIWSLESLGAPWPTLEEERDAAQPVTGKIRARAKGFLSPNGKYGHDGFNEHQLLFTHIGRTNG